jgi:hypothetical protein
MTCKKVEKIILSTPRDTPLPLQVSKHLQECATCRELLQTLQFFQKNSSIPIDPPTEIMENIFQQARKNVPTSSSEKRIFYPILRPALAAAALFILLIGIFISLPPVPTLQIPLVASDLQSLQEQSISIMYQGFSEEDLAVEFLMSGTIPENFL